MEFIPEFFNDYGSDDISLREILWSKQSAQNATGTWNLNKEKYPFCNQFFEKSWSFLWRPDEIDMSNDPVQFQEASKDIQFGVETVLSFLQYLDSIVSEDDIILKVCIGDYEIKRALGMHEFVEGNIHTFSYQFILKTIFGENNAKIDEVYYRFKNYPPLAERNRLVSREFYKLRELVWNGLLHANEEKYKRQVFRAMVQDFAIERVVFYAGFNFFHFLEVEQNMLSGVDRNIVLIRRDEELHVPLFANILKTMKNEPQYYWNDDEVYEIMANSAKADIRFYQEAIGDRIPGLTSKAIETYIKYMTDKGLKLLGLKPLYNVDHNPFEHVELVAMGSEFKKASFFETGNTDYQHVSTNWESMFD